ncbi:tail fiber assembly protein [Plesiomonas shigelloides]|uniref:tail fiber assembly protein n=1 Tax=Plesiomonas shigelloides TaxID=703 RepID=UPI0012613C29|nr:tail fiber assembly protein [Plesiomonas shigelloides]KAB7672828.1 tail fiber assembly protein [Plesiomonas shigelloides]
MVWYADETHEVEIAVYDNENRVFDRVCTYRAIAGCGLPPNTCFDFPESRIGYAAVRSNDDSGWEYVEDHRGEVVYSTETGAEIEVTELGQYPNNTTLLKRKTPHDFWNGSEWVTDTEADHAAEVAKADADKSNRLTAAKQHISLWQTQLQLGMISDADKAKLIEWMHYITALQAVDTSTAPDINWPKQPAE